MTPGLHWAYLSRIICCMTNQNQNYWREKWPKHDWERGMKERCQHLNSIEICQICFLHWLLIELMFVRGKKPANICHYWCGHWCHASLVPRCVSVQDALHSAESKKYDNLFSFSYLTSLSSFEAAHIIAVFGRITSTLLKLASAKSI